MIRTILLATALSLPLAAAPAACAMAQETAPTGAEQPATLSLSASGEVSVAPDIAIVTAGAVTQGASASEALRANAQLMISVFAELDRAGIAERDRQTSNLQVNPVYRNERNEDGSSERRITGYEARNQVSAVVRDLAELGNTVDALVEGGANELQGVNFSLDDASEARDEARRRAVAELMRLKDLYADAADLTIVRLQSLSESGGYRPQPMAMARMESMSAADSTPIAAGELSIEVSVSASWVIEG